MCWLCWNSGLHNHLFTKHYLVLSTSCNTLTYSYCKILWTSAWSIWTLLCFWFFLLNTPSISSAIYIYIFISVLLTLTQQDRHGSARAECSVHCFIWFNSLYKCFLWPLWSDTWCFLKSLWSIKPPRGFLSFTCSVIIQFPCKYLW